MEKQLQGLTSLTFQVFVLNSNFLDKITLGFYDTSLQKLPKIFEEYEEQPVYVFYPAFKEPRDPIDPERYIVQRMMR